MKPVHNTHKGLTAQNKVSLLLFLQLCKDEKFSHIVFEDPNWEDATLHFKDGRRMFLEVKDSTTKDLGLSYVKREIFSRFKNKVQELNKDDKILIAAPKFKDEVQSYASSLEYLSTWTEPQLKKKGFNQTDIQLLKRTITFEYNELLDENILAYLVPILGFWLPESELVQFKDHLLQSIVATRSASGASLTVQEFIDIKEQQRKTLQVGMFDEKNIPSEARIQEILSTLNDNGQRARNIDNPRVLSSLMSNPGNVLLLLLALENKIVQTSNVNFQDWTALFQAAIHPAYSLRLIHVFERSLAVSDTNSEFFLKFWTENIIRMTPPLQDGYLVGQILAGTTKIIEKDPSLHLKAFELVMAANRILSRGKFGDKEHRMLSHDQIELGKLLFSIFGLANLDKKAEILEWAHANFNLNRDDGKYLFNTPGSVYDIWRNFILTENTIQRLGEFINVVDEDYLSDPMLIATRGKKKGLSLYEGYDHVGGGIANDAGTYSLIDRAYIERVLKPTFEYIYHEDESRFWNLLPNYITTKETEVGIFKEGKRPDYLSRALIPTIVRFYFSDDLQRSNTAYSWLCSFIKFHKGIPSRTELLFQELMSQKTDNTKTWNLVRYQMDISEYKKMPANIFVEKILQSLLEDGMTEPIDYVSSLIDNELYLQYRSTHDFYLTKLIQSLINKKETIKQGTELLRRLLDSDFFNKKLSDFEVYDIKSPIQTLYDADPAAANALLYKIISDKSSLTPHRQIALTCCMRDMPDDAVFLSNVYKQLLETLVENAISKKVKLSEYLDYVHTREELAEFAGKLCKAKLLDQGLAILELLAKDPSPSANEYLEEMRGKNDVHAIQSVKAHVAWALQSVISIEGRPYLSRALKLVRGLATDKNVYIKSQACFPLTSLVQARHWRMPNSKDGRYIENLQLVQQIDDLALRLLETKSNHAYPSLTKAIIHSVSYIRALDMEMAKRIVNDVLGTNEAGIIDYMPTLIFFAEFREHSFLDWPWGKDFPLGRWDSIFFQNTINGLCENGSPGIKGTIAWTLWSTLKKNESGRDKSLDMINRYSNSLIKVYGPEWYDDLYHLANELRECGFVERAINIWESCATNEHAFNALLDELPAGNSNGRYYDGEMLLAIFNTKGDKDFQKWLSFILEDKVNSYLSNVKELYDKASDENKALLKTLYPYALIDKFKL